MNKSHKNKKIHAYFTGVVVYALILFLSNFTGRYAEVYLTLLIIPSLYLICDWKKINIINLSLTIFLLLIGVSATLISIHSGADFSIWQFFRSSVWLILSIVIFCLSAVRRSNDTINLEFVYNIVKCYVVISAIAVLAESFLQLKISPSIIRLDNEIDTKIRIYIVASTAIIPFLLLTVPRRDWIFTAAILTTVWISGGKTFIAMAFIFIMMSLIKNLKSLSIYFPVLLLFLYSTSSDFRIQSFFEEGDAIRKEQVADGINEFSKDTISTLIGIGHAVPYSLGYSQYNSQQTTENFALLENSIFDVENFYVYILMRLGIVGAVLFLILTFRVFSNKFIRSSFIISILLYSFGGALFTSPGGVLYIFSFLIIASIYESETVIESSRTLGLSGFSRLNRT